MVTGSAPHTYIKPLLAWLVLTPLSVGWVFGREGFEPQSLLGAAGFATVLVVVVTWWARWKLQENVYQAVDSIRFATLNQAPFAIVVHDHRSMLRFPSAEPLFTEAEYSDWLEEHPGVEHQVFDSLHVSSATLLNEA